LNHRLYFKKLPNGFEWMALWLPWTNGKENNVSDSARGNLDEGISPTDGDYPVSARKGHQYGSQKNQ
jgi:hypothetical protein